MGIYPYRPLGRQSLWTAPAERQYRKMRTARERKTEHLNFLVIVIRYLILNT